MNPEEQLRALRDPDRWTDVRVPRAARAAAAEPRRFARFVPAVAAFVIAIAAVGGIALAFGSIGRGGAPAASATPSTPSAAGSCASGQLTAKTGDAATEDGYRTTIVSIGNSGSACALPISGFTVGGRAVSAGAQVADGAVRVPAGDSELYLRTLADCAASDAPKVLRLGIVTLRVGDAMRTVGSVRFAACGSPVLGQFDGGSLIPADKLAGLAAHPEVYYPSPTPTPPAPTVACTATQLTVTAGEFGGEGGNWIEPIVVENGGEPCFLLPSQFAVGSYTAGAGRDASRLAITRGRTVVDVMAYDGCAESEAHGGNSPVRLDIGGATRTVGTFVKPFCGQPFTGITH